MDKNRISTGYVTHEFRTNRMVTDSDRTSNGCLCPFCPVETFETDIKRIRTDTNGLKEVLSVTHPLARCDRNFKYDLGDAK